MTIIFSADQKNNLNWKNLIIDTDIDFKNYFLIYRSILIFDIEISVEHRYRYRFFRALISCLKNWPQTLCRLERYAWLFRRLVLLFSVFTVKFPYEVIFKESNLLNFLYLTYVYGFMSFLIIFWIEVVIK